MQNQASLQETKQHGAVRFPFNLYPCTIPGDFQQVALHWHESMELAVVAVQCLFHLAEVCDTFVYRTVTRLLAGDIEECFWISHDEQIKKLKN